MKQCSKCLDDKPFSEFHKDKHKADGHSPKCKKCKREYNRRRLYGTDGIDLLEEQDGKCKICKVVIEGQFNIDHDHQTNAVRGVLCSACNVALGLFGDSVAVLEQAIEYLKLSSYGGR